jgi:two-component sensor histidine kinase
MDPLSPLLAPPDLAAEANHRIANSLALLGSLVRMQARLAGRSGKAYSGLEIRFLFDGIAARIASIGQLHRMLSNIPPDGVVRLNGHLRDVASALIAAYSSDHQPVRIEHRGMDCLVLTKYVQPLTLILCEILTNAMKYAHPAGAAAEVHIACEAREGGTLVVSIGDDGVGLPDGFDPSKDGGVGFQIIRALCADMEAGLEILSGNLGLTVRITIPAALVANARRA